MPVSLGGLELYDVEELSEKLGIQERTVRKLLKDGKLRGRKLAKKWYVSSESLREYFSQPEPTDKEA
jgi:excisionase family DNA binding protein